MKWAFNAQFERICLSRHLGHWLEPNAWRCTMVWSAYMGLPLSLEGAGAVLGLEKQKLKEGKDLIRFFSVPSKPTLANGQRMRNLPKHAPEKWAQFKAYNARDVETELSIQARLQNFPVPAAHLSFISNFFIRPCSSNKIALVSCPPISKMARRSG